MLTTEVREIMTPEVITTDVASTIFEVMETMARNNVGGIVITDKQRPVGIFTEQDVLKRVMNKKLDPRETAIMEVMTAPIRAIPRELHIIEALGKMYKSRFRHFLIRGEKREIVGIISIRDILRFAVRLGRGLPETKTIDSIMSSKLITVEASCPIYDTIETMLKNNAGCVIVSLDGKPKGIFTERDVLKRVAIKNIDSKKTGVKEVMTADFVAMAHSALIGEVLSEMQRKGFRHMPIREDKEKVVGIVSLRDLLKYAKALDVDESVRKAWKEIEEFWESEDHYTPG
ncbi:MAG: cyclic nucleotide-binding/CBS domain-containing protein [Candidatus Binatia bacterium]